MQQESPINNYKEGKSMEIDLRALCIQEIRMIMDTNLHSARNAGREIVDLIVGTAQEVLHIIISTLAKKHRRSKSPIKKWTIDGERVRIELKPKNPV